MPRSTLEQLHQINYLCAELDALYHRAALRLGLSDSAVRVLYTLYDQGGSCPLSDVYKQSGISKQTVNSAVRKLEQEQLLYLEPCGGRAKRVSLTPRGSWYADQTVARLYQAERDAFAAWGAGEVEQYIALMQKHLDTLAQQVKTL